MEINNKYKALHKTNRASINYLYEVSAIPETIRIEYLNKLLRRKNAHNQKNVRLIKIIYNLIEEDRIKDWNPFQICLELQISDLMLRYHKSRFLRDLRKFYFGWEKIEKECFPDNNTKYKEDIETHFMKAKKMYEIGMRKEAKNILLKLDRIFDKKLKANKTGTIKDNYLLITEIYELLLDYYFSQRYLFKFNTYFTKLNKLTSVLKKNKKIIIPHYQQSIINYRLYNSLSNRYIFHYYGTYAVTKAKEYLELALKEAKQLNCTERLLITLVKLFVLSERLDQDNEVRKFLNEGYNTARQHNYKLEYFTFKSLLLTKNFKKNPIKSLKHIEKFKYYYKKVKEINPHTYWFIIVAGHYSWLLDYFQDYSSHLKIKQEIIRYHILYPRISLAWCQIYELKFETKNVFAWTLKNTEDSKKQFLTIEDVNYTEIKKLEALINETLSRFKDLRLPDFKTDVYTDQLWTEFMKGKDCNYERALIIFNKIKRMTGTNYNPFQNYAFRTMYLGISMIEESHYNSKKKTLYKYLQKFNELAENLIKKHCLNLLISYSILCFIANQLNYKEIWDIVINQYRWIVKNNPEIIKPIVLEIKNRNSNKTAAV